MMEFQKVWAVVVACRAYLNVTVLSRSHLFTVVKKDRTQVTKWNDMKKKKTIKDQVGQGLSSLVW